MRGAKARVVSIATVLVVSWWLPIAHARQVEHAPTAAGPQGETVDGSRPDGPVLFARYHGTVTYYGAPARAGMLVGVYVEGTLYASATVTESSGVATYDVSVPADDPDTTEVEGPTEGDQLAFRVNGVLADEAEQYNVGEDRVLDLHVSRIEICLGAYEDLDRDDEKDPAEPWLAGVAINVLQFFVVRSYTTTGNDEPSCTLHEPVDTTVRAVNWPDGYDPPTGQGQPSVIIDQHEGVFEVLFAFVEIGSAPETAEPTTTPTSPTPTADHFPGPTGQTPSATDTPAATSSPIVTRSPTPATTFTPTATSSAEPAETPTGKPTPDHSASLVVNSASDPGQVGDGQLTLREAMLLATGRVAASALSPEERQQVEGEPGPDSNDFIRFDPKVFRPNAPATIVLQPPLDATDPTPTPEVGGTSLGTDPRPALPPLDTGGDVIDASGAGVVLSAGVGGALFDGLLIESDGNAVRGLGLRNFNAAIVVAGGASSNELGGRQPGQGLTVTNNIAGIVMSGSAVSYNRVLGSRIGVDRTGRQGDGNAVSGVLISAGAHDNVIGEVGAGNIIGANYSEGIAILGAGTRDNVVQSNMIGTDATGKLLLSNGMGVIVGGGALRTIVGGTSAGSGNVIGGNVADGIWIEGRGTVGTLVQGNVVGVGPDRLSVLSNGGAGVLVTDGAQESLIGGTDRQASNLIIYNIDAGVRIRGFDTVKNTIRHNSITRNGGPGIVLEAGGNGALPAPTLGAVGPALVDGMAPPGSVVEIFSDPAEEGAVYEGTVRADGNGYFSFEPRTPFAHENLHATATDAEGNTSAFGAAGQPPPTATEEPTAVTPATPPGTPLEAASYLPVVLRNHVMFAMVTLEPYRSVVPMGGIVTLELRIDAVKNMHGLGVHIEFTPRRLEVIDADPSTPGVQIQPDGFPNPANVFVVENSVDNARGTILYSFTLIGDDPVSGSGVVARIKVRGRGPGAGRLDFREIQLANSRAEAVRLGARGALVTVLAPPTATPAPTRVPTLTNTPTRVPTRTPPPTNTRPPTATEEPTSTRSPTATRQATASRTPTGTRSATPRLTPTDTRPATATRRATGSPEPSVTRLPTHTPAPTRTSRPTDTARPSATATASATRTPSETPRPSTTLTPTGTAPVATGAPTNTPAASPTPDGCRRPLENGGYESDAAWVMYGSRLPRYVSDQRHGGERSLLFGWLPSEVNAYGYSTAWQPVPVPWNARTMTIGAWTYQASEPGGGPDRQAMLVYDIDPAYNWLGRRSPIASVFAEKVDAREWQRRTLTLGVSSYRGGWLWIYMTVFNDGLAGHTWMYADDVEVAFCR